MMLHVHVAYRNLGLDPIWPQMMKHEVGLSEPIRIAYINISSLWADRYRASVPYSNRAPRVLYSSWGAW